MLGVGRCGGSFDLADIGIDGLLLLAEQVPCSEGEGTLNSSVFPVEGPMSIAFRASHALDKVQGNLGLLGDLPGTFIGTGFNLIARPDKQNNNPFFLELNATQEILEFANIGGDIRWPHISVATLVKTL
jgi:hypothetical protein